MSGKEVAGPETSSRALTAYFAALAALDPQRIATVFAADGEIEDPVGTGVRHGREQIGDYFAQGLCRAAASVEIEVLAALPAGRIDRRALADERPGRTWPRRHC